MGVSDSLAAALKRQLLTTFPSDRIPHAADLLTTEMNPLVARFLEAVRDRHVVDETNRLSYDPSEWIPADWRSTIEESIRQTRKVIAEAVSFPPTRWEYFLGHASEQVCRYLVSPVDTLFAYVFPGDAEAVASATARRRIRSFGAYNEILDPIASSLPTDPDQWVDRLDFRDKLNQVAHEVGEGVLEWESFAEPLFSLHEEVNGYRAVPVGRLASLADAVGREDVADRIRERAAALSEDELTEEMLRDLMAPSIESEDTPEAPDLTVDEAWPEESRSDEEAAAIWPEEGHAETSHEQEAPPQQHASRESEATKSPEAPRPPVYIDPAILADSEDVVHDSTTVNEPMDLFGEQEDTPPEERVNDWGDGSDQPTSAGSSEAAHEQGDQRPQMAPRHAAFDPDRDSIRTEDLSARPRRTSGDPGSAGPVPLWKQFHKKLNAPISADRSSDPAKALPSATRSGAAAPAQTSKPTRAASASDPEATEESVKPLWLRYQTKPERPREAPAAMADVGELEQSVFGREDVERRRRFINELFDGSSDAYLEVLGELQHAGSWAQASGVIADKVFRRYRVNIYSDVAVTFTNAVERRFL